ncbi:MAG: hypothetical protein COB04_05665 [Gammaproteobacteria bacterium]|nr:MAG: hypothetical protein COB04_05665 [Gammaproteobacteria bacterium]
MPENQLNVSPSTPQHSKEFSKNPAVSPTLSIIIPALNEAGIIDRLLQDLVSGITSDNIDDVEIIVCDSHSQDDTAYIVAQFAQLYPSVVSLVLAPKSGVSLARNLASQHAQGKYLAFLDADARITLKCLLNGVAEMKQRNLVSAAYKFNPSSDYLPDKLLVGLFNLSIGIAQYLAPTAPGAAGYLIKKEAHDQCGGFNESMHFGEDVEYLRRASEYGTYRVLNQGRIQWDMRRFNEEGRVNVVWKMLYGTVAQIKNPAITELPFDYKVGHFGNTDQQTPNTTPTPKILAQSYKVIAHTPRVIPAEMASPFHFLKRPLGQVDFLDLMIHHGRRISPYCLDDKRRCMLFIETEEGIDLLNADPFFYEAQRDHAIRIYAVPYGSLGLLADLLANPPSQQHQQEQEQEQQQQQSHPTHKVKPVFLHSTGRCGSTLLSQLMDSVKGVISISEPDFYSQAMILSNTESDRDEELKQVLNSCTRLLSYHLSCTHKNSTLHLIKLRSWTIFGARLLEWQQHKARHLFLYRQPLPTINSFLNAYFSKRQYQFWRRFKLDTVLLSVLGSIPWTSQTLGATVPLFNHPDYSRNGRQDAAQYFTLQWLSHMSAAEKIKRDHPQFFAEFIRYEELKENPSALLEQIMSELQGDNYQFSNPDQGLDAILSRNSQQGSRMQSKGEYLLSKKDTNHINALLARTQSSTLS